MLGCYSRPLSYPYPFFKEIKRNPPVCDIDNEGMFSVLSIKEDKNGSIKSVISECFIKEFG
ncbi:hypothetical protein GCM10010954_25640 [Halobacillus andaensis]|uniref:Uncharacterized protein n=1 Tax=Halobacillus andaensis TaxID=1176239 RepID=A0A917EWK4_HALAA|nr:hypothetical protein GCM10010954_25640 [Halobacillus andaensis]